MQASKIRVVAYWVLTGIIAFEMIAGSCWDLLNIEYVNVILKHLGYPSYLHTVIGIWKLPCGLALLAPAFPRLKEWAYAGAVFNYWGATSSHFLAGDGPDRWVGPAVLAGFTLASWALRPAARRLPSAEAPPTKRAEWVAAAAAAAAMLVISLLALPKGPPPGY
jgi:uncharacterized membrane protein YphA (DoxX/SURF4 family)